MTSLQRTVQPLLNHKLINECSSKLTYNCRLVVNQIIEYTEAPLPILIDVEYSIIWYNETQENYSKPSYDYPNDIYTCESIQGSIKCITQGYDIPELSFNITQEQICEYDARNRVLQLRHSKSIDSIILLVFTLPTVKATDLLESKPNTQTVLYTEPYTLAHSKQLDVHKEAVEKAVEMIDNLIEETYSKMMFFKYLRISDLDFIRSNIVDISGWNEEFVNTMTIQITADTVFPQPNSHRSLPVDTKSFRIDNEETEFTQVICGTGVYSSPGTGWPTGGPGCVFVKYILNRERNTITVEAYGVSAYAPQYGKRELTYNADNLGNYKLIAHPGLHIWFQNILY